MNLSKAFLTVAIIALLTASAPAQETKTTRVGKLKFTDVAFFRLLLDCEIPVVAALQGHCIGGGFAFACFADLFVLAEEACVSTNFMTYGFTPGMGATYIVPNQPRTVGVKFGQKF